MNTFFSSFLLTQQHNAHTEMLFFYRLSCDAVILHVDRNVWTAYWCSLSGDEVDTLRITAVVRLNSK